MIQQITEEKIIAQQRIDELTVQQTKAQQKIDDLILLQTNMDLMQSQSDPTPQQIENQQLLEKLILQLHIQEQLVNNLKFDELEAKTLGAHAIAQQIAAKILFEEQTLKKLESEISYIEQLLASSDTVVSESLASQLLDAQQIINQISAQKTNVQRIVDNLNLELLDAQQIADPQYVLNVVSITDNSLLIIIVIILSVITGLVLYLKLLTNSKHLFSPSLITQQQLSSPSALLVIREPVAANVKLTNNVELSYEKWKNIHVNQKPEISLLDFWIPIVNTGDRSITNVSMGFIQTEHEITKQDLTKINMIPLPDLLAGDYYYHPFSVYWKQITQLNISPIFVGIYICYDAGDNIYKNEQYAKVIYKIDNNKISLL